MGEVTTQRLGKDGCPERVRARRVEAVEWKLRDAVYYVYVGSHKVGRGMTTPWQAKKG